MSYSAYEQHRNGILGECLDYIESKLNAAGTSEYMMQLKEIDGRFRRRVYVGEFGAPANTGRGRLLENKDILVNAFSWGCPLVVYWSVLENEWNFQSGTNTGRGLYLPTSPASVEPGDDAPAVDVEITNVGIWFRSLLGISQ